MISCMDDLMWEHGAGMCVACAGWWKHEYHEDRHACREMKVIYSAVDIMGRHTGGGYKCGCIHEDDTSYTQAI